MSHSVIQGILKLLKLMAKTITIELDWPCSVNHYYKQCGNRRFIGAKGIAYRQHVILTCRDYVGHFGSHARLRMEIQAFPPDKRKRDLDNPLKACWDSLQHAQVYVDDSQIDQLLITRMPKIAGKFIVTINEI